MLRLSRGQPLPLWSWMSLYVLWPKGPRNRWKMIGLLKSAMPAKCLVPSEIWKIPVPLPPGHSAQWAWSGVRPERHSLQDRKPVTSPASYCSPPSAICKHMFLCSKFEIYRVNECSFLRLGIRDLANTLLSLVLFRHLFWELIRAKRCCRCLRHMIN